MGEIQLILLSFYVPIAVLGSYRLWINWHRDRAAVALYTNIIIGSLCQSTTAVMNETVPWTREALVMTGDIFLVISFLLILHNWSVMTKRLDVLKPPTAPPAVILYIVATCIIYALDGALFGLSFMIPDQFGCILHLGIHILSILVASAGLVFFPFYGHRMQCVLQKVGEDSPKRMRNIFLISLFAAAFFAGHATTQGLMAWQLYTTCTSFSLSSLSLILALVKGFCVLGLLVVLPCKPKPSRHGYIRLRSNNS